MNESRSRARAFSREALARYEQDGFFFPLDVLDSEEVAAIRTQLEDFEERYESHPAVGHGAFRTSCHLFLPFLDDLIRHPAILDAVSSILGDDLLVWGTSFFTKEPRSVDYVAWHQDLHYWGLDARDEVTAWVALSQASVESGCMRFVPASHSEEATHADRPREDAMLSRGQELIEAVDDSQAVNAPLLPGQISLHHGLTFHASMPNRSDDRRIGFAIRYIKPSMRQVGGERGVATLVQGEDRCQHFELAPRPQSVAAPEGIAVWQRAVGIQNQINFRDMKPPTDKEGALRT
jgi:ectoine hydroxylase-related dioxygenase (phytanoyl-CoA dioxygenase family)